MRSPDSLAIHLLGHPRFFWDGESHKFSAPPRTLPLLAFLLLNRGAHLSRDTVAFSLWPDDSEESARTNLRRHLNYLKNALPRAAEPWFIADAESVTWNDRSPTWLDIDAFESLVACRDTARDGVEHYAGDLLTGSYDDWLIGARERLRSQYLGALDALLLEARSRRNFPAAIDFARRLLHEDPWREDTLRHLLAIRYESGDRSGALNEFETFFARLRGDGGDIEPMPETLALRETILRGAPLPESPQGGALEEAQPNSGALAFPFVGRAAQLAQLTSAWTRAARGRGSLVLVSGEAGTGKSRIASELALLVGAQGGRVLRGATPSPEQRPYQSIVSALRSAAPLIAGLDIRPVWLHALRALLPELDANAAEPQAAPSLDPEREQARLFEALAVVLSALAKQRPTLLIVEDLHWAGASTLAAIEYVTRRSGMQSLLILGTYRGEDVNAGGAMSGLRRRLSADELLATVALGGLAEPEVRELVRRVALVAADAEQTGKELFALTSGNALFVCELLRDRMETPNSHATVTPDIRQTIRLRAERLSPATRILADAASVVGLSFDLETVGQLAGADEAAVLDGVAELLDRRMVKEVGHGRFEFAFTHHLIQTTLYADVDDRRRLRWHRRAAGFLSQLPEAERAVARRSLARHYEAGGEPLAAAGAYLESAHQALAIFANDEAFDDASAGLRIPELGSRLRFALLLARERASAMRGERDAQERDLDALAALCGEFADADTDAGANTRCEVIRRRVRLARARSETHLERTLVDELVALALRSNEPRLHAEALQERASSLRVANEYDAAYAAAHQARTVYASLGDETGALECDCLLAEIAATHGSADEMRRFIDHDRAHERFHQNKALFARSTMAAAGIAIMQREYSGARDLARKALELYREIGDREGEADAQARFATALGISNRLDDSRREFAAAAALYRRLGKRSAHGYLLFNLSGAELQLGRVEDARRSLLDAEVTFTALADRRGQAVCWTNLSMVALLRGEAAEARRIASDALDTARELKSEVIEAAALSNLGNAERDLALFDDAVAHMHEALAIRERMGHPGAFEELADLARTHLEAGDVERAVAVARKTLERAQHSNEDEVWLHYCFWVAARAFTAAGARAEAAAALARADALLHEMLGRIADSESRNAFMALGMNVGIRAAVEHGVWPEVGRSGGLVP